MMGLDLILAGARLSVACVLGAAVLWQVADRSGPLATETVIHVTVEGVDVFLDDSAYRVDDQNDSPIIRELQPGWHTLRMMKDGETLYDRPFEIARGDSDLILTAWNELHADEATGPGERIEPMPVQDVLPKSMFAPKTRIANEEAQIVPNDGTGR